MNKPLTSFVSLGLIALLGFPFFVLFIAGELPSTFWGGAIIGFLTGIVSICLNLIWKSTAAQSRKLDVLKLDRKWIFPLAFALLFLGRVILEVVNMAIGMLIAGSLVFWIITVILYFLVQTWQHGD